MNDSIRRFVNMVCRGEVPEGYKKTKAGIIPADWDLYTLDSCLERVEKPVEVRPNEMYTQIGIRSHGKGLFYKDPVSGMELGNKSVFWIEPGCFILNIVFAWEHAIGKTTLSEMGMIGSHRFPMYRPVGSVVDVDYIIFYFLTKQGTDVLVEASPGGAGRNKTLGQDRFLKSKIVLPPIAEQRQIAKILATQDKAIELQQRKVEELKNLKKVFLSKMFPKDGCRTPELRFKGFTGEWEQRKFSELYEKVSRKNDLTYGKDDIISVANMYFKPDSYITDDSYLLTYNVFELGDIAFEGNRSKNFAHGRFVENTIGNGIVSHVFDVFHPVMKQYDLQFWKYAINNERIMGSVLVRCTKASTMMTNLIANDFLNESILLPTYEEQKKIGAFLLQLDGLITLHQHKRGEMERMKKALMQLLLTGIVRVTE